VNVEKYISSGILEAYLLGELSHQERAEVEQAAEGSSEIREELALIEQTMESLVFAMAKAPRPHVKDQLLGRLEEEAPVVSIRRNNSFNLLRYAAAASVFISLVSVTLAYTYWKKWQNAESQLAEMITQNAQFAENYNTVNLRLNTLQNSLAVMNNSEFERVEMNGTDNDPQALATVYWNEASKEVFLSIQNLKNLSKDQQYQLWAIIDGKPVDAGVFEYDPSNNPYLVQMKPIGSGAAAFAVTIEPRGGSENPSLETMQVIGNV